MAYFLGGVIGFLIGAALIFLSFIGQFLRLHPVYDLEKRRNSEVNNEVTRCRELVVDFPIADVIPIPDGATNGDMIKIMFPYIEIEGIGGEIKCIAAQIGFGTSYFALDWWNAPYKRGRKE